MCFVDSIRHWDELFVPSVLSRFVSTDQQEGNAAWIEGVQDTIRTALVLNSQFSHVAEGRALDTGAVRMRECRSFFLQQSHYACDGILLSFIEGLPPGFEFVGELDLTCHKRNITFME